MENVPNEKNISEICKITPELIKHVEYDHKLFSSFLNYKKKLSEEKKEELKKEAIANIEKKENTKYNKKNIFFNKLSIELEEMQILLRKIKEKEKEDEISKRA